VDDIDAQKWCMPISGVEDALTSVTSVDMMSVWRAIFESAPGLLLYRERLPRASVGRGII